MAPLILSTASNVGELGGGRRANLERVVGGAEGVVGAPHLRHAVPPRLLRPVVGLIAVAVAVALQGQRHHLLSPPPHRRRLSPLPLSLSLIDKEQGRRRRWKLAAASGIASRDKDVWPDRWDWSPRVWARPFRSAVMGIGWIVRARARGKSPDSGLPGP